MAVMAHSFQNSLLYRECTYTATREFFVCDAKMEEMWWFFGEVVTGKVNVFIERVKLLEEYIDVEEPIINPLLKNE